MDFLEPIHGVAPGQVAAIWYQKWCLGSGVIQRTWTMDDVPIKSFREMKQENWDDSKGMGEGEEADGARERAFAAG